MAGGFQVTGDLNTSTPELSTLGDTQTPLGPGAVGMRTESRNLDMAAAFDDFLITAPAGP